MSQRYRQNTDTAGHHRDNGNGRTNAHKTSTERRKALMAHDNYSSSDVHYYVNGQFVFVAGSFSWDSKISCAEVLDLITSFLDHWTDWIDKNNCPKSTGLWNQSRVKMYCNAVNPKITQTIFYFFYRFICSDCCLWQSNLLSPFCLFLTFKFLVNNVVSIFLFQHRC